MMNINIDRTRGNTESRDDQFINEWAMPPIRTPGWKEPTKPVLRNGERGSYVSFSSIAEQREHERRALEYGQ